MEPQAPEFGITFGISPATNARLRDALGHFASLSGVLRITTEAQLVVFADVLRDALKHQWKERGHDRSGAWNDPSLYEDDYVHSIDQIEIAVHGLTIELIMRGGWVFVQYGSASHVIEARNGPYMTFQYAPGRWASKESVETPGYAGDDVLGAALHEADIGRMVNQIIAGTMFETWGHAEDRFGQQYTGGEQLH